MTVAEIAKKLHGRKSGTGWIARCPAHDDKNPSLSLRDVDGKLLVRCHAGCDQRSVIAALKALGLWPEPERRLRGMIIATYGYTDPSGGLLYQVIRYEPKDFKQRHPDGAGGWIWRKHLRQVLHHLPEMLEAPIVFVVEGERDVETLRAQGFVATTNAGGANATWLPEYTQALRGRDVILIPDNDPAGRRRVLTIARALLGYAARIVVLEIDGAKDITDWFAAGHTETELLGQLEGVPSAG